MNLDIEVNKPTIAIFATGSSVNEAMMTLANDTYNGNIKAVKRSYELNDDHISIHETDPEYCPSDHEIYMWYDSDDQTIYYYSDAIRIRYNKYNSYFYRGLRSLQEIDDIKTDIVYDMYNIFAASCQNLDSIYLDLSKWDVRNLNYIHDGFQNFGNDTKNIELNLDGWTMDSIVDLGYFFYGAFEASEINSIENIKINMNNWTINSNPTITGLLSQFGTNTKNLEINARNMKLTTKDGISEMFYCSCGRTRESIKLDLSGFEAPEAVYCADIFLLSFPQTSSQFAPDIITLDVTNWKLPKANNLSEAFMQVGERCYKFEILGLDTWDTSGVVNMDWMFHYTGWYAQEVSIEGLENWDVSSVTNMKGIFKEFALTANEISLDLSKWDTSSLVDCQGAFFGSCTNVKKCYLNISNWDFSNFTGSSLGLLIDFARNAEDVTIIAENLDFSNLNAQPGFSNIGYNAKNIEVDLSNWKICNINDFVYEIGNDADYFKLNLSNWDFSNISRQVLGYLGKGADYFELDASNWTFNSNSNIVQLPFKIGEYNGFADINISNWKFNNVTSLAGLFKEFAKNTNGIKIDVSGWDTSNITDMSNLFNQACGSYYYTLVHVSGYQYNQVLYDGEQPRSFEIVGLDEWDVSNVTNMAYMFDYAFGYFDEVSLDLSSWDISNVANTSNMFRYFGQYSPSVSLNITGWNIDSITNKDNMFDSFAYQSDDSEVIGYTI